MQQLRLASSLASSLTLAATLVSAPWAQAAVPFLGNEIQLSDGGDFAYIFSNPSVGGTLGAPDFGADLFYKGVPENRFKTATGTATLTSIEDIFLGDVDWPGGPPDFYDIGIGGSSAVNGAPFDNLCPDIFSGGALTALISLGNSGLPHPCVISPTSTCSGSAGCPPLIAGYIVDVSLGSPISISASSSQTKGVHLINFLPGGMTFGATSAAGSCGSGDYVFQGDQSVSEEQADVMNLAGTSWCEGFQLGSPTSTGPIKDSRFAMSEMNFGLLENVIEAEITDTGTPGYGPVRGGASLAVDTATGTARIAAHVTADPSLAGRPVFSAASLALLPTPFLVFGANLCILPDGTFSGTLNSWAGTGALIGIDENGDGVFDQAEAVSPSLPLPIVSTRVYLQSFIATSFIPLRFQETTVWTIDLR